MDGESRSAVLVADDERTLRRLIERVLAADGIDVVGAADAKEAARRFEERAFGVAVIDVNLPPAGFAELCEAIRERSPDTHLILISGAPLAPAHRDRLEAWGGRFLEKPFASRDLLRTVQSLLAGGG